MAFSRSDRIGNGDLASYVSTWLRLKHFAPWVSKSKVSSEMVREGMNRKQAPAMRHMRHCLVGKSLPELIWKTEFARRAASRGIEILGSARSVGIIAQRAQRIRSKSPHDA
jgi:hypothetical protein